MAAASTIEMHNPQAGTDQVGSGDYTPVDPPSRLAFTVAGGLDAPEHVVNAPDELRVSLDPLGLDAIHWWPPGLVAGV